MSYLDKSTESKGHLDSITSLVKVSHGLMPFVIGFMLSNLGVSVSVFDAYHSTNGGSISSNAIFFSSIFCIAIVVYFRKTRSRLKEETVERVATFSFVAQALSIVIYGFIVYLYPGEGFIVYACGALVTLSSWFTSFYWLRRARNFTPAAAVILVFGAITISEIILYLFVFIPTALSCIIGGLACLLQFACRARTKDASAIDALRTETPFIDYFGFEDRAVDAPRLLSSYVIGIVLLFVVSGTLRGFPSGDPIHFTDGTRFAYIMIAVLYFAMLIWRSFVGSRAVMTSTIWLSLEIMGIAGLLMYAAFPHNLEYGAVFTTVFSAGLVAFMAYLIIAFASVGDLDAYYYTAAGFLVCITVRVISRLGMSSIFVASPNSALELLVLATLILISTQIVLTQLIWIERKASKPYGRAMESVRLILGLDRAVLMDKEDVRQILMENQVAKMQEQFQLTDRETEVLTLYALGKTQRAIATELVLSQGTIHTHIKNIYAKTDLHSRQEVLDFLGQAG